MVGAQPHRATSTGDLFDANVAGLTCTIRGIKLTGGSAAAAAQLTDANGTILADLACPANGSDVIPIPIAFVRKVTLTAITGTGASIMVWI